ncbi:response regulator [Fumia xinanensis]|uniref:Stage 0 sporulation protein A homolog n=1 Tax=Fumia xinanensis TaxID=2763659 RepID=A0A926I7V6_9FIRM|nr:response regulator [Fumia xinanensis]MBC8560252.1 response regulator [Fumia xinanensis]
MKQKTEQGHLTARYRLFTFFVLVLLAMIAVAGLWGSQRILLKNAARMGQNLAQSYASDEQHHIEIYQNVIRMGMTYLEDYTAAGASYEKIESWMIDFFQKAADATGEGNITFYAIVDEKIIASQPFEGIEQYDFRQATWYQQAIDARGQVIFTDAYKSVTGRQVVTVAAASPKSGNIIVIDLFTENFEHYHKNLSLIEDGAYYLCDSSGNLLFYSAPFDVDEAAMENYVKSVVYKASTGEQLENGKESFRDLNGKARGLYYYQMPNGWLSILSVPRAVLLEGMGVVVTWYAVLMVVFLTASVAYWLREGRLNKTIERTNDTIRVLGNSYYAIYRVDVDKGEYEMTKGSDYARQKLPYKGSYEALPETEEQNSAAADVLQGRHILLVEDNPLNMEITAELLKMRGAQVTPAANGREAVEAFEKSEPGFFDGILMDMQMPEMDGCEAARAIRNLNRPDARAVPIVAQTANAFAEDISRTEQAGMNAHLSKPIDMEQLCCILEELFTKR